VCAYKNHGVVSFILTSVTPRDQKQKMSAQKRQIQLYDDFLERKASIKCESALSSRQCATSWDPLVKAVCGAYPTDTNLELLKVAVLTAMAEETEDGAHLPQVDLVVPTEDVVLPAVRHLYARYYASVKVDKARKDGLVEDIKIHYRDMVHEESVERSQKKTRKTRAKAGGRLERARGRPAAEVDEEEDETEGVTDDVVRALFGGDVVGGEEGQAEREMDALKALYMQTGVARRFCSDLKIFEKKQKKDKG
jgi:hypothetical protein